LTLLIEKTPPEILSRRGAALLPDINLSSKTPPVKFLCSNFSFFSAKKISRRENFDMLS